MADTRDLLTTRSHSGRALDGRVIEDHVIENHVIDGRERDLTPQGCMPPPAPSRSG